MEKKKEERTQGEETLGREEERTHDQIPGLVMLYKTYESSLRRKSTVMRTRFTSPLPLRLEVTSDPCVIFFFKEF